MNKDEMIKIAESINLVPTDDVIKSLGELFDDLSNDIDNMRNIDTSNVKAMNFVDESPINFLREDVVGNHLDKKKILENAHYKDEDFVIIPKGGSND